MHTTLASIPRARNGEKRAGGCKREADGERRRKNDARHGVYI